MLLKVTLSLRLTAENMSTHKEISQLTTLIIPTDLEKVLHVLLSLRQNTNVEFLRLEWTEHCLSVCLSDCPSMSAYQ